LTPRGWIIVAALGAAVGLALLLWWSHAARDALLPKLDSWLRRADEVEADVARKDEAIRGLAVEISRLRGAADRAAADRAAAVVLADRARGQAAALQATVADLEAKIRARDVIGTRARAIEALRALGYGE